MPTNQKKRLRKRLQKIYNLNDFEIAAESLLPRRIFGFIAGGAEDGKSIGLNRASFDDFAFNTRVLVDVSQRSQEVELLGRKFSSPFAIAPVGIGSLAAYQYDRVVARAAEAAGIACALSGSSLIPLEAVAADAPSTWFQVYVPGDQGKIDPLLDRVEQAGYTTLVLTVDVPVAANRENNLRNGFSTPLRPSIGLAMDGLSHPRWLWGNMCKTLWQHGIPHFENSFATRGAPIVSSRALREFSARDHLSWDHLDIIRKRWRGNLIIKGILSADDAALARNHGADGIVVSNHGGRQLDGAVAPLRVLQRIVESAGCIPVMMDGGVRRGSDVLKALALGARMVFLGRPFVYAATIAGEVGVAHAISLLKEEIDRNMVMLGIKSLSELTPSGLEKLRA